LTEQFHVSNEYHDACDRLTTLVQKHTHRLLTEEYWSDKHLDIISDHTGQSYTYIRDNDRDDFADVTEYVYDRFKRCVYHRVTHTLDAHADEYRAFQFVCETVQERKVKRIGWHRLRKRLFDDDSPHIEWRVLKSVVEQLNDYYDRHGRFPDQYTELVETPEPNGTLPYAPDRGDYHIHELSVEDSELVVTLNAPDTISPDSFHDWTDHEIRFPVHSRFSEMVETGEVNCLGVKWFENRRFSSSWKTPSSVRPRGFLFPRHALQIPRGNPQGAQSPQVVRKSKIFVITRDFVSRTTWIRPLPDLLSGDGGASDRPCF
jgi:hypothetical protein